MSENLRDDTDAVLEQLRTTLRRLPTQAQALRMERANREMTEMALQCRGDVFAADDILVLSAAEGEVFRIPVSQLPIVVGRGETAGLRLKASGVSETHCRIDRKGRFLLLMDLRSKNGTYLNGEKVSTEFLARGDSLGLGTVRLTVQRA